MVCHTNIIWTNLIGSSTCRLPLHIRLVVKKDKLAQRFDEIYEQEIIEVLDNTTPKTLCLSI